MFMAYRRTYRLHRSEDDKKGRTRILNVEIQGPDRLEFEIWLLEEFTPSGGVIVLVRLELSARELPEATVTLVRRPLTDKQPPFLLDHCCNHANWFHGRA